MLEDVSFPPVSGCLFLKSFAHVGVETPLPDFIELDRTGKLLAFRYNFKTYTLGISRDGWLAGFRGAIKENKAAEIVILRTPAGEYRVYDARHTAPERMKTELAALVGAEMTPSGVAMAEPTNYYGLPMSAPVQTAPVYGFSPF